MSWPEAFASAVGAIAFMVVIGMMLGAIEIKIDFRRDK